MNAIATPAAVVAAENLSRAALSLSAEISSQVDGYQITRRNGSVVPFVPSKIAVALMKAFIAVRGSESADSASIREIVASMTDAVVRALLRSRPTAAPSTSRMCKTKSSWA